MFGYRVSIVCSTLHIVLFDCHRGCLFVPLPSVSSERTFKGGVRKRRRWRWRRWRFLSAIVVSRRQTPNRRDCPRFHVIYRKVCPACASPLCLGSCLVQLPWNRGSRRGAAVWNRGCPLQPALVSDRFQPSGHSIRDTRANFLRACQFLLSRRLFRL